MDKPKPRKQWTTPPGWKRNFRFPRDTMRAFETYIANVGLPTSDRALLAAMICEVAPKLNAAFDRERFIEGCGLELSDVMLGATTTVMYKDDPKKRR